MNNDNLWAPWRMAYLKELKRKAETLGTSDLETGPFLSEYFNTPEQDEANHVVFRNEHGIVLLNRFPYATGHLLAALGDPRPTLLDYTPEQRAEFWRLVEIATELVQRTLRPQGINTGINQGRAAGAGLPDHLHAHVVPRWHADTNFMSIVPQVRVIPQSLDVMADQLRATSRTIAGR